MLGSTSVNKLFVRHLGVSPSLTVGFYHAVSSISKCRYHIFVRLPGESIMGRALGRPLQSTVYFDGEIEHEPIEALGKSG